MFKKKNTYLLSGVHQKSCGLKCKLVKYTHTSAVFILKPCVYFTGSCILKCQSREGLPKHQRKSCNTSLLTFVSSSHLSAAQWHFGAGGQCPAGLWSLPSSRSAPCQNVSKASSPTSPYPELAAPAWWENTHREVHIDTEAQMLHVTIHVVKAKN